MIPYRSCRPNEPEYAYISRRTAQTHTNGHPLFFQFLRVEEYAKHDRRVEEAHERACEENVLVLVHRAIRCPQEVEEREETPRQERESLTTL